MPAHVAFCKPVPTAQGPIAAAQTTGGELVADAGTSTAAAEQGDIAIVTATSDVYVDFGVTPSATAANHFIPSGQTMAYAGLRAGWKMAVAAV